MYGSPPTVRVWIVQQPTGGGGITPAKLVLDNWEAGRYTSRLHYNTGGGMSVAGLWSLKNIKCGVDKLFGPPPVR